MNTRTAPWFKFYPADFMNGVRGLSAQEVGLYQMLLCLIYEEDGPVEFNVLRLATYCGMRKATFTKTVDKLIALGKLKLTGDMLSNDRAEIEISKRAIDLENASKAGKASAKKRQENQEQAIARVQQAFNNTDSETDTNGGGSACASKPLRVQILAAMGIGSDGVIGPSRFIGGQGDMAEVKRWLSLPGITEAALVAEIRAIAATKADGPPKSFRYFTSGIQRLSSRLTSAPLQPTASQKSRASLTTASASEIFARVKAQDAASVKDTPQ